MLSHRRSETRRSPSRETSGIDPWALMERAERVNDSSAFKCYGMIEDGPMVFDWGRWGVMPAEETVPPAINEGIRLDLPTIGSGEASNEPPVIEWGTWEVIPSEETGSEGMGRGAKINVSLQDEPPVFDWDEWGVMPSEEKGSPDEDSLDGVDVMDQDSRMEPFDMQAFVDRIVEDVPPAREAYIICDAPVAADIPPEVVTKSENRHLSRRSDYGGFPLASPGAEPVSSDDAAAPTRCIGADDESRHTFLRQQETIHHVGPGYLAGPGLSGPSSRTALVDHVSRLHAAAPAAFGGGPPLSLGTLFLAVNLIDRFLSTDEGGRVALGGQGGLKVAATACLGISSKYEDNQSVATSLWGLAVAGTRYETGVSGADDNVVHEARKALVAMERGILPAIFYRLSVPTALSFLEEFIRRASLLGYLSEGPAAETVQTEAQEILLRVLRDVTWLEYIPSALAAAALYRACTSTPGAAPPSSAAFLAVTGYQLEALCRCLQAMDAVRTGGGGTGRRDDGLGFD